MKIITNLKKLNDKLAQKLAAQTSFKNRKAAFGLSVFVFLLTSSSWVKAQGVVVTVTIAPLAGLVAPLLDKDDRLQLLLSANNSPHGFQLKPSHLKAIQKTDLLIMNGAGIDNWINKPIANINNDDLKVIRFAEVSGLKRLALRQGTDWQQADDGHAHHHGHDHSAHNDHENEIQNDSQNLTVDGHFWLDIDNAISLVKAVSLQLQQLAPTKQASIAQKEQAFIAKLKSLDNQVAKQLKQLQNRPFLVLHDAFQYFEAHYRLNAQGAIQLNPSIAPSVRRVYELREKVLAKKIVCVFKEPQFPERRILAVTRDTGVKIGVADPLGMFKAGMFQADKVADHANHKAQSYQANGFVGYIELYQGLANQFEKCLAP